MTITNDKVLSTQAKEPVIKTLQNYREIAELQKSYGVEYPEKYLHPNTGYPFLD